MPNRIPYAGVHKFSHHDSALVHTELLCLFAAPAHCAVPRPLSNPIVTMDPPSDLFSVAGKNCLVTGGSRGIGKMIALTFARRGANVLIASRSGDDCAETAEAITRECPDVRVLHQSADVGTREGCRALAERARCAFGGRLDVLVNNAGTSWGEDPDYEHKTEEGGDGIASEKANWGWDKVMDLNVKGVFYLTRECAPMLERVSKSVDPGRVINVGSVAGVTPQGAPTHAYDVSKAAVHHLTRKLASDLAPRGITVNALAPGYVPSKMTRGLEAFGASLENVADGVPMGRLGNEDDMGGACVYLASAGGSWVTGTVLVVDGGAVGAMQVPLSSL